ncbi:unnamed protein product [Onchocerca ochengi]|uniref:Uncharacterized protein n=1 Tax=Onchocerca ochengi TaxID=42157 RepID=A0A182EK28_ONCOC|nr:unnamed protein product [Onchocerca ochengi]
MLLDKNDELLSTLFKPLADVNDNLDDDEIEKLPLQLQYYEGHRCQDPLITSKIIDSLYQKSRNNSIVYDGRDDSTGNNGNHCSDNEHGNNDGSNDYDDEDDENTVKGLL